MRKGFTLIELLVVVLIMGILASVAMPQYFITVEKSRASEAIDALSAIASSEERYYMQKGEYTWFHEQLDIGLSNLSYFTFGYPSQVNGIPTSAERNCASLHRIEEAGGGLGKYWIAFCWDMIPGNGNYGKRWECSPLPLCGSFLPKERAKH